jgi:hypothetical protein
MMAQYQGHSLRPPPVAGCVRCEGEAFSLQAKHRLCIAHVREVIAVEEMTGPDTGIEGGDTPATEALDGHEPGYPYEVRFRALSGMRIGA